MSREFTYIVTKEDEQEGCSIITLVRRHFACSSRLRKKIKKNKAITVNGAVIPVWKAPHAGDAIAVRLPEEASHFPPEAIPVDVIYEDDDLLIVNKQAGITVHPTNGRPDHTLANALSQYMLDTGQRFKIRFINRLDMDTSGLVACGKNAYVQNDFVRQSRQGLVRKEYTAIVDGLMEEEQGVIDLPIGRPADEPLRRGVVEGGKPSVTHYRVLARFPEAGGPGYSLVRLRLETGRTHQIRVHMCHIGHTVTGDWLYESVHREQIGRQALHASRLSFRHPISGAQLDLHAPLPADMQTLLGAIGGKDLLDDLL